MELHIEWSSVKTCLEIGNRYNVQIVDRSLDLRHCPWTCVSKFALLGYSHTAIFQKKTKIKFEIKKVL